MKNLHIHNPRYITYTDDIFTIDVLGGIDVEHVERMICTLRIRYSNYPPFRSTLDLYSDSQTDQIIRTLCDKWSIEFVVCSRSIHNMLMQLEDYRFERLRYPRQNSMAEHLPNEEQQKEALSYLSNPHLAENLQEDLRQLGLSVGDENALILFLTMASRNYEHPFSVVCTVSGNQHYTLLEKLSACLPEQQKSMHTHISENALYYFERYQVDDKVLFIEDLEWTPKMLKPFFALQSTGRLTKTQAIKTKDGLLYATTFEVQGKLCMIACTSQTKKKDCGSFPFLTLPISTNFSQESDLMNYEKQCRAGLINPSVAMGVRQRLQQLLQSLPKISIRNPYAPLIELPKEIENPNQTLLLLLDFIEVITFFFQHQRTQITDPESGEIYIESQAEDVALAFRLLKKNLLANTDDMSSPAKALYNWLQTKDDMKSEKTFTAADIRKEKPIHPRTLNRYLKELCFFHYLTISGGNKYRGGYRYCLTDTPELYHLKADASHHFENILKRIIKKQDSISNPKKPLMDTQKNNPTLENQPLKKGSRTVGHPPCPSLKPAHARKSKLGQR